jgi:ferredoxin
MAATHPRRRPFRRLAATSLVRALALALTAVLLATGSGTAQAADGYKYWNYFHVQDGAYVFATTGPADFVPEDGTVEAYRYGLSSASDGLQPRTEATTYTVEDICADDKAGTGQKRVGVLIDYGTPTDAPKGAAPPDPRAACAVVAENANGQQVLDAAADLRLDKGIVCGIDGYPASTCSVTVKNAPAPATEQAVDFTLPASEASAQAASDGGGSDQAASDEGGVPWPLVGVAVAVLVLGGGALALSRRNRNA